MNFSSVVGIPHCKGQYIFSKMEIFLNFREDLIRAYDIYGLPLPHVQGKLTKKAIACAVIDPTSYFSGRTIAAYYKSTTID
jgi:hypothetical protein